MSLFLKCEVASTIMMAYYNQVGAAMPHFPITSV